MTLEHKILGQITVDSEVDVPDPKPFVTVVDDSTPNTYNSAYSTDGINWTGSYSTTFDGTWRDVAYGNGVFAAIQFSGQFAYSSDGINWTLTSSPAGGSGWTSVVYALDKFVAVSEGQDAGYSTDGINWVRSDMPSNVDWSSITYGLNRFVAVSTTWSTAAAYSTNGIDWSNSTLPSSQYWNGVSYGDGIFVAISQGDGESSSAAGAYSDSRGLGWTAISVPIGGSGTLQDIAYGNGAFVVVIDGPDNVAHSTNGIAWTNPSLPSGFNGRLGYITYGEGKFIAQDRFDASEALYSTDGISWTVMNMPSLDRWVSVAAGDANYTITEYTNHQTIYTVPANTETMVSSIFISNNSNTTGTYNFAVVPDGETVSDIHYIRKNAEITGKDFHQIDTKLTLSSGDSLVALSSGAIKLNITATGVEKS